MPHLGIKYKVINTRATQQQHTVGQHWAPTNVIFTKQPFRFCPMVEDSISFLSIQLYHAVEPFFMTEHFASYFSVDSLLFTSLSLSRSLSLPSSLFVYLCGGQSSEHTELLMCGDKWRVKRKRMGKRNKPKEKNIIEQRPTMPFAGIVWCTIRHIRAMLELVCFTFASIRRHLKMF